MNDEGQFLASTSSVRVNRSSYVSGSNAFKQVDVILRHPLIDLPKMFKTESVFDDLLHTGVTNSAVKYQRARDDMRTLPAWVPYLMLASFFSILFLHLTLALVFTIWSLYVRERSRVIPSGAHYMTVRCLINLQMRNVSQDI